MLRNGDKAPNFSLADSQGKNISLADFKDKPVVLVFVRGAFCPTTLRFLTAYQDFHARIKDLGMELLVISTDTVADGAELTSRLKLSFPLLSDPDAAMGKTYGAYVENKHNRVFVEPAVVIIDKDGEVAYSVISSGPKGLPEPGMIAPVLIYMQSHNGKY